MIWEVLAVVWTVFLIVAVVVAFVGRRTPRTPEPLDVLASRLRERVVVTCRDGQSFVGVLYEAGDRALVLRDAAAVGAGENRTNLPLDGEVIVPAAEVVYLQRAWAGEGA